MIIINKIFVFSMLLSVLAASGTADSFHPAVGRGLNVCTDNSTSGFLMPEGLEVNATDDSVTINATAGNLFEIMYLNGEEQVTDLAAALTIVTGGENITAQLGEPLYQSRNPAMNIAFVKNAAGTYKYEMILFRPGIRIRQNAEYWTFFDGNDTKAWLIAYQKEDGQIVRFIGPSLVSINAFTNAAYTYKRQ